jgi:hypothetical protein
MWTSLMLITGIGAAFGNLFFREALRRQLDRPFSDN